MCVPPLNKQAHTDEIVSGVQAWRNYFMNKYLWRKYLLVQVSNIYSCCNVWLYNLTYMWYILIVLFFMYSFKFLYCICWWNDAFRAKFSRSYIWYWLNTWQSNICHTGLVLDQLQVLVMSSLVLYGWLLPMIELVEIVVLKYLCLGQLWSVWFLSKLADAGQILEKLLQQIYHQIILRFHQGFVHFVCLLFYYLMFKANLAIFQLHMYRGGPIVDKRKYIKWRIVFFNILINQQLFTFTLICFIYGCFSNQITS